MPHKTFHDLERAGVHHDRPKARPETDGTGKLPPTPGEVLVRRSLEVVGPAGMYPSLEVGPFGGDGVAIRDGERKLHTQRRTCPLRAVQKDSAAERLDPVLEADQPSAAGELRAPGTVVADLDAQDGGVRIDGNHEG